VLSIPAEGEVQPGLNAPLEFSFTSVGTALPIGSIAGRCDGTDQEAAAAGAPEARSRIDRAFPKPPAAVAGAASTTFDWTIGAAGSISGRGTACGITTMTGFRYTAEADGATAAARAGAADAAEIGSAAVGAVSVGRVAVGTVPVGTVPVGTVTGNAAVGDGLVGGAVTGDVAAEGAPGLSRKFAVGGAELLDGVGSPDGAGAGRLGDAMIVGPLVCSICAVLAR
jgi:hypothetical protein